MLPNWLIEQRQKEKEEKQIGEQPRVYIDEGPITRVPRKPEDDDKDRGVIDDVLAEDPSITQVLNLQYGGIVYRL